MVLNMFSWMLIDVWNKVIPCYNMNLWFSKLWWLTCLEILMNMLFLCLIYVLHFISTWNSSMEIHLWKSHTCRKVRLHDFWNSCIRIFELVSFRETFLKKFFWESWKDGFFSRTLLIKLSRILFVVIFRE